MKSLVPALVASWVALAACSVDVDDYAGRRCDQTRGCLEGRVCVEGLCVASADGGAGTGDGGAQQTPDASVTWRQDTDGFDRTRECTSCSVVISPAVANRVDVSISSAVEDQAVAVQETQLARAPSGNFGGTFTLSALPSAPATIVFLESDSGGSLVRISVGADGAVTCASSANTLHAAAISLTSTPGRVSAGAAHALEIAFDQGRSLTVRLDGEVVCSQTLAPYVNSQATPKELRIGIDSYDGTASSGLGGTLSGWLYAQNPAVRLFP